MSHLVRLITNENMTGAEREEHEPDQPRSYAEVALDRLFALRVLIRSASSP